MIELVSDHRDGSLLTQVSSTQVLLKWIGTIGSIVTTEIDYRGKHTHTESGDGSTITLERMLPTTEQSRLGSCTDQLGGKGHNALEHCGLVVVVVQGIFYHQQQPKKKLQIKNGRVRVCVASAVGRRY